MTTTTIYNLIYLHTDYLKFSHADVKLKSTFNLYFSAFSAEYLRVTWSLCTVEADEAFVCFFIIQDNIKLMLSLKFVF